MAQSLSNVLIHTVFSTKDRAPLILPEVEARLYAYIKSLCDELKSPVLFIGGMPDHIHILLCLSRSTTISDLNLSIKANSSKFMKSITKSDFSWQKGYGAFSIGESVREATIKYIANQKEHHKTITFKDEFLAFLNKNKIVYDEKYLWN